MLHLLCEFAAFYYVYEQTYIRPANIAAEQAKLLTKVYAGAADGEDLMDLEIGRVSKDLPFADLAAGGIKGAAGLGWGNLGSAALNYIPYGQTLKLASNVGSTLGYASYGVERDIKASFTQGSGGLRVNSSATSTAATYGATMTKVQSTQTAPAATPTSGGVTSVTNSPSSKGGGVASSSGGVTYTVKAGDTLGNIASKNGTTATALGAANGIKNLNVIRPGQKITIPKRK